MSYLLFYFVLAVLTDRQPIALTWGKQSAHFTSGLHWLANISFSRSTLCTGQVGWELAGNRYVAVETWWPPSGHPTGSPSQKSGFILSSKPR